MHFTACSSERLMEKDDLQTRDDESVACGHEGHRHGERRTAHADAASLEGAARIFRAVADPARLRILEYLDGGEMCVTDLAASSGAGLSTVSQQLRVLRSERLVSRRREGKHIFYALADDHIADLVRSVLDHVNETKSTPDTER
jgi:ArsR family transcriptional regulator, lead/cadmium/zinc/bismuth-responsive transcriptional repressor